MRSVILLISFILLTGSDCSAQDTTDRRTVVIALEYTDIFRLADDILRPEGTSRLFEEGRGAIRPSLSLYRNNLGRIAYLGFRLAARTDRNEREVPQFCVDGDTIEGQTVIDVEQFRRSILDLEAGRLWSAQLKSLEFYWGGGVFVDLAHAKNELSTQNNLSAYEGVVLSSDSRLRGAVGLRPRIEVHAPVARRWGVMLGASYHGGLAFLPDVVRKRVEIVDTPTSVPFIQQESEELDDVRFFIANTPTFWFRLAYTVDLNGSGKNQ